MKFGKKGLAALAAALCVAFFAPAAMAVEVDSFDSLQSALNGTEGITVTGDFQITSQLIVSTNATLDLNGHTVSATLEGADIFVVTDGATFTINDTAGGGKISSNGWAAIQILGETSPDENASAINSKLILNGGTIEAQWYPITVMGKGAQFDINDGIVQVTAVDGYAVSGSSATTDSNKNPVSYHGTIINVNGGQLIGGTGLESDSNPSSGRDYIAGAGIFHSQEGVLNITGGTVSGYVGIQFRSGTLNMTGGTVISNGNMPTAVTPSSNGVVAIGAGIAFITNGDPEKVGYRGNMSATISGDAEVIATGEGSYAIYEANHETAGNESDTQLVALTITSGTFEGKVGALSIQNKGDEDNTNGNVSISGGAFSSQPEEKYLAENVTFVDDGEGHFVVPSLTFATNVITLAMNETITLDYTVVPANAMINWTSSNPEIATVDANGEITPAAAGETTITATLADYDTISASCTVTVTEDDTPITPPVTSDDVTPPHTGGSGGGCSAGFGALALLAAVPLFRMRKR
ncbi:Ig-like domain-containing protein [Cloacibacillus sp. An23]|uniref:Ig-like domain-containing protein n=1 Tax=Cloacibacillus sp. An23 TaxID=1965591 RepID=UPI000B38C168|nr:Ig-like domain-containing protein [Cloacibacillus sp. An23]OUO92876.1 hypothetical protein B5F39_09755 [Cloacibacillus sp. An23]